MWSAEDMYGFDRFFSPPNAGLNATMPMKGDLSREQAKALGLKAIAATVGVTTESLAKDYMVLDKLCLYDPYNPDSRVWRIALMTEDVSQGDFNFRYYDWEEDTLRNTPEKYGIAFIQANLALRTEWTLGTLHVRHLLYYDHDQVFSSLLYSVR